MEKEPNTAQFFADAEQENCAHTGLVYTPKVEWHKVDLDSVSIYEQFICDKCRAIFKKKDGNHRVVQVEKYIK